MVSLNRRRVDKQRTEFLTRLARGGPVACAICGESRIECLNGGHIRQGDGRGKHARELGVQDTSDHFRRALARLGWPAEHMDRMQIECANCNAIKKFRHWEGE